MKKEILDRVLAEFSKHVAPLGPLGDLDTREKALQSWLDSLSAEEVLALLKWARNPVPLPGYGQQDGGLTYAYIEEAAVIAGIAGRRLGDQRIRQDLESMLHFSSYRELALAGLEALADPKSIPALTTLASEGDRKLARQLVSCLEEIGGRSAHELLVYLRNQWAHDPLVLSDIDSAISTFSPNAHL